MENKKISKEAKRKEIISHCCGGFMYLPVGDKVSLIHDLKKYID